MIPPPVAVGGAPLAHPADRFLAALIDSVIVGAILAVPLALSAWYLFARMFHLLDLAPDTTHPFRQIVDIWWAELLVFAILVPVSLAVTYLYYVTFMHRTGQTVGKRAMKIKVVRLADGSPIDAGIARRRWTVQFVAQAWSAPLPGFAYADLLWLLWDVPYRQCLHDKVAQTAVVKVNAAGEG
jgi:uncharacterized RDD family membrane protein YckC